MNYIFDEEEGPRQPVAVIRHEGGWVLIQDQKTFELRAVPAEEVRDGTVSSEALQTALLYGIKWEDARLIPPTAEAIVLQLRKHGIHTREDALRNVSGVRQAVRRVVDDVIAAILNHARNL